MSYWDNSFQSTPSAWRETMTMAIDFKKFNISIHSLRMEGDQKAIPIPYTIHISIHSLRMEGDNSHCVLFWNADRISIHSLRMEGDPIFRTIFSNAVLISIHSLRMEGDSRKTLTIMYFVSFQSTPSAWRETPCSHTRKRRWRISIHSLRMEGDDAIAEADTLMAEFQSTPSAWRETNIHQIRMQVFQYFNPLPPHGGRRLFICRSI